MLNGEGIYRKLREMLWDECEKTSKLLNNLLDKKEIHFNKNSPPQSTYHVLYGKIPKYFSCLSVFGGIVILNTSYSRLNYKIKNKGTMEIFLGYYNRHVSNVYRMFNLTTQSIIISHDISWMNINYGICNSHINNDHDSPNVKEKYKKIK